MGEYGEDSLDLDEPTGSSEGKPAVNPNFCGLSSPVVVARSAKLPIAS